MTELWSKTKEKEFFTEARTFASPEKLFYHSEGGHFYAYWPKSYKGIKNTLQSRNSLIGNFTEKYIVDLFQNFANSKDLFAVQGVICEEIGLSNRSPADVVVCRTRNTKQKSRDILAIIEVKMSIVWNWELLDNNLVCLGDYKTHKGNPGLLRSDSMLKAIGKSISIRVSGFDAASIPIIILGNTPITKSYYSKVDHLKKSGIIQGFCFFYSNPLDNNGENIKTTKENGFIRMDSYKELENNLENLLLEEVQFFSSMKTKKELGSFIEIANRESKYEEKAEKFLTLIRG